jgi:5-methylcytosine-specific restriction endonuclease McrA
LAPKEAELVGELAPEPRFLAAWRGGRYIPARVKRAVWQRDDGRCGWRFDDGQVCGSRDALEFDHFRPFAKGGRSDDARNVRLLCRMHNRMAARSEGMLSGARAAS